jgi:hypothetical protein
MSGGAGGGAGAGQGYAATVLSDEPAAYYRVGEPAGAAAAIDSSAAHRNAAYRSVDAGRAGAIVGDPDTAIHLRGMPDSNIFLGDRFDFAGKVPFSFEVWLNPNLVDAETRRILGKTGANGGYVAVFNTNGLIFYRSDVTTNADLVTLPRGAVPLSSYTHVVVTFDGVALKIYGNGLLFDSAPATISLPDTSIDLLVGDEFGGDLDELAIYDKALTEDQIRTHHRIGAGML